MTGDKKFFAFASLATAALLALGACDKPKTFEVLFETSKGNFTVTAHRDWSPLGAERFHELVEAGFYNEVRFFRVIPGFVAQFGISGTPSVAAAWKDKNIADEPVVTGNKRGRLVYAKGGPNTRTTQLFINLVDNDRLDGMGFPAFAEVTEGMSVVDSLYGGYGDNAVDQGMLTSQGNAYLAQFPLLDYVKSARIVAPGSKKP